MKNRSVPIAIASFLIFAGGALLSLTVGATSSWDPEVFWLLRLPRTLSAVGVGGGLAVAGSLIQASLGNPLADPYTIGIASAAALGAVLGTMFRQHQLASAGAFAFVFAIGALLLLSVWLRRSFRHSTEVLLAGVVMGFFFTSLATLVMVVMDPASWSAAMTWILGAFGWLSLSEAVVSLALLVAVSAIGWLHWKPLDLMSVDETSAESAGVDVAAFRKRIFILVALITAISVSTAGVIGFVGLIVPHVLRKAGIRSHRSLIPLSFVMGAGLLLVSDVGARVIVRPSEIPVGVIMAILGAPFFLWLARSQRNPV